MVSINGCVYDRISVLYDPDRASDRALKFGIQWPWLTLITGTRYTGKFIPWFMLDRTAH